MATSSASPRHSLEWGRSRGVLVIDTGGTITMVEDENGTLSVPEDGHVVRDKLRQISSTHKLLIDEDGRPTEPPPGTEKWWHYQALGKRIDSSDSTPQTWQTIADEISKHEDEKGEHAPSKYDGYVVLHGTDTMAYVSAALAFLLPACSKPIIITGAQVPIFSERTDAANNLLGALDYATRRHSTRRSLRLRGAFVFFDNKLMRAAAIVKVDSQRWDAFHSPRAPLVGEMKEGDATVDEASASGGIFFDTGGPRPKWKKHVVPAPQMVNRADFKRRCPLVIQLYPGINLDDFCLDRYDRSAVIISAYGSGNGPHSEMEKLKAYLDKGGLVAVVTECLSGCTSSKYAACVASWDERIAVCATTTLPAAVAKVTVYLGKLGPIQDDPPERHHANFVEAMRKSWAGEILYDNTAQYLDAGVHQKDNATA